MSNMASKLRPNNSFKPKLLRSGNGVAEKACHAVTCATQFGLTQALGPQEQSQHAPGSAQTAVATCITQQPLRGQSEQSSPASNCKQLSLRHQDQDQDLQPANAGRARASATRRTACPTSCYNSAVRHVHCAVQSKSTGLTIRSSRARFAVSARLETSGQRAGLTQALGLTTRSV